MKIKVDKTLAASVALHVLVIGWGLVSFSSKAFESVPEESLPVDIISADQLAHVTAGMKTGKKEEKKPLVEKVAELPDQPPPLRRRHAAPRAGVERGTGRGNGPVYVFGIALGDVGEDLSRRRIVRGESLAGRGRDPFAVDEHGAWSCNELRDSGVELHPGS